MRQIVASNQSGVLPVARVVGNDYLYVWSRTISGLQQHYKTTTWSNFLLSRDDNPYSRSNEKSFYIYAENCVGRKRAGKDRSVAPRRQPTLAGESSSGPGEWANANWRMPANGSNLVHFFREWWRMVANAAIHLYEWRATMMQNVTAPTHVTKNCTAAMT